MVLLPHFQGAMLGHALGDALGVPFEGVPSDAIVRDLGGARRFLAELPVETLIYSDDTQMMIGVAQALIETGRVDQDQLVSCFARNYESYRGYGRGVRHLLESVQTGGSWQTLATNLFPGGSFGNGAAMRATPLGLFFHDDLAKLDAETTQAAVVTHTHPLGIDGAVIFAAAVALALRGRDEPFHHTPFFEQLIPLAVTEEFQWQLRSASRMDLASPLNFGSSLPAQRSVTTALCCFAQHPNSFEGAVAYAINLGDDTDTVAGMAGALVAARRGLTCLSASALAKLENGPQGRDYLMRLATDLHDRFNARQRAS